MAIDRLESQFLVNTVLKPSGKMLLVHLDMDFSSLLTLATIVSSMLKTTSRLKISFKKLDPEL